MGLAGDVRGERKAVHRVVTDGVSPEQTVDEAIAQISRS